jgi:hypothetical protein
MVERMVALAPLYIGTSDFSVRICNKGTKEREGHISTGAAYTYTIDR